MEVERVLDDSLPALQEAALTLDLGLDASLQEAEAVHVLELGLRAELIRSRGPDGDVRVDAQRPLLHVHVGDAELADRGPQELSPLTDLLARAQVRLGDDLDQGRAGPVEIDERGTRAVNPPGLPEMNHLGRV